MSDRGERQKKYRAAMYEAGFTQVNIWVPPHATAAFQQAARLMRENPELTLARLRDLETGRLMSLYPRRLIPYPDEPS